jgi:hypothetical protein
VLQFQLTWALHLHHVGMTNEPDEVFDGEADAHPDG